jgi:hypothetical protein
MKTETFEKIVNDQITRRTDTLIVKAREYATEDRLHNFKIAATIQGCTPVQALAGMMAKHTVSVYDLCRQHNTGLTISADLWDEKITDSINYLLLLKAAISEPEEKQQYEL